MNTGRLNSKQLISLLRGREKSGETGSIYCVAHPSLRDTYKIGKTGSCVNQRISVLNTSEVHNFEKCWDLLVRDYHAVEQAIHIALSGSRISPKKEFFCLNPEAVYQLRDLVEEHVGIDVREYIDKATAWMRPREGV